MKNKITIGIFNDSFYPMTDGVVLVVDNYARRLAKYANVIVFVPEYKNKKYDDSIFPYKVVRCKSLGIFFLDYSLPLPKIDRNFKKEIDKYKLDIVHIHSPFSMGNFGIHYAKKYNVPCIGTMHSQFKQDFKKALKLNFLVNIVNKRTINLFNKCDECWAVNKEVARIYYEDYHYKCMPRVMNNATEMLPVKDIDKANKFINELYNIDNSYKVLLFVGRINTLKNILFIADSLGILKKINPSFKFKMLFVGSGKDSDKLEEKVNELQLNNDVVLCGKVTDREVLAYYFARADLFLFPSKYDASSIVQIEAASQKTSCLFLKGTATSSTVTDDVNGYLCDDDPEIYAKKILDIFSDEDKHKKISNNAFRDLYKNWDDCVKEVYELYLNAIKSFTNK